MFTRLAAVSALSLLLSSCGVFGSDYTVKRTVSIHAAATDPLCSSSQTTYNLADDKSFQDVKDYLWSIELKKVRVVVLNPQTDEGSVATSAHGSISISGTTGEALTLGTWQNVPLSLGASQEIAFDKTAAKKLGELALKPPHTFVIASNGCTDAVPAAFDFQVEMTFYATVGF